jgi:ABC-type oligopeptide transport system substrate-binding subunit
MDLSSLSGNDEYKLTPHISNYESEAYNAKIEEAFAEKDLTKRFAILQEAEKMLMEDMPVCPIVFNQNARLVSNELSGVKYDWFGLPNFKGIMLKDFERFAESTEGEEEEEVIPGTQAPTEGE